MTDKSNDCPTCRHGVPVVIADDRRLCYDHWRHWSRIRNLEIATGVRPWRDEDGEPESFIR